MEIFDNEDYKFIGNFIEQKIPILKENKKFKKQCFRLNETIEKLEQSLSEKQKEEFDEIIQLFYNTEEYYFAFSYSLGVKYGNDLKKL